mgnify:CR=1 FL=1
MFDYSDDESVFGDTAEGVPNPQVPHEHPYPTRYHGPMWAEPQATYPFKVNDYALAPYAGFGADPAGPTTGESAYAVLSVASMGISAYHGYKRNNSVGWAIWWGLMGSLFPVITPVIAYAEGYAQPKKFSTNRPKSRSRRRIGYDDPLSMSEKEFFGQVDHLEARGMTADEAFDEAKRQYPAEYRAYVG